MDEHIPTYGIRGLKTNENTYMIYVDNATSEVGWFKSITLGQSEFGDGKADVCCTLAMDCAPRFDEKSTMRLLEQLYWYGRRAYAVKVMPMKGGRSVVE